MQSKLDCNLVKKVGGEISTVGLVYLTHISQESVPFCGPELEFDQLVAGKPWHSRMDHFFTNIFEHRFSSSKYFHGFDCEMGCYPTTFGILSLARAAATAGLCGAGRTQKPAADWVFLVLRGFTLYSWKTSNQLCPKGFGSVQEALAYGKLQVNSTRCGSLKLMPVLVVAQQQS